MRTKPRFMGKTPGNCLRDKLLVRDLIESFEEDCDPVSTGRDALWALEMIFGVYAAHRHGRTRLPLEEREHPLKDWVKN